MVCTGVSGVVLNGQMAECAAEVHISLRPFPGLTVMPWSGCLLALWPQWRFLLGMRYTLSTSFNFIAARRDSS